MKKFFKEYQDFARKGNALDLAIAVVVGGAFGKITTSLVNDIITPVISLLIGNVNFSELKLVLIEASLEHSEVAIRYGAFLQTIFDFLIISFSIFLVYKILKASRKKIEETAIKVEQKIEIVKKNRKKKNESKEEVVAEVVEEIEDELEEEIPQNNSVEVSSNKEDTSPNNTETNLEVLKEIRDLLAKQQK